MIGSFFSCRCLCVRLLILLFTIFGTFCAATALDNGERITSFQSDITVERDATIDVTEHIVVAATGLSVQHGIFRDIVGNGGRTAALDVESVTKNGTPEPFHVSNFAGSKRIYIGDPKTIIPSGEYTYELRYRVHGQLLRDGSFDRLYWNVTGNRWTLPLGTAAARVHLPTGDKPDVTAYTGAYGDRNSDFSVQRSGNGELLIQATESIPPGSGLTIDVRWPHSVSASILNRVPFVGGLPFLVISVALLAIVLWWAFAWLRAAPRLTPAGEGLVASSPPRNLSPVALRYAREGFIDNKAFTAALIDLAARGVVRIEHVDGDHELSLTHAHNIELPAEERELKKTLFGASHSVSMKRDTRRLARSLRAFAAAISKEYASFVTAGRGIVGGCWLISGCSAAASLVLLTDNSSDVLQTAILCGFLILTVALLRNATESYRRTRAIGDFLPRAGILAVIAMAVLTTLVLFGFVMNATPAWWAIVAACHIVVNLAGERWVRDRSAEAIEVAAESERFRNYLLNRASGELTSRTFDQWAAYAVALDIEAEWLSALRRSVDAALAEKPAWFSGETFDDFYSHPYALERQIVTAEARTFVRRFPWSSGSGGRGSGSGGGMGGGGGFGGGFSGGGSGGGGGGGW